jgi:hypothetical protein
MDNVLPCHCHTAGGKDAVTLAAAAGQAQAVQLLLACPQLKTAGVAGAAQAAAAARHTKLAVVVLWALLSRKRPTAAAAVLADRHAQPLAIELLQQWQAADNTVRDLQARKPALQQLLLGNAASHQQLRAAAADITASAVGAALQAATPMPGGAPDGAAVMAAASAAAAAAVADVVAFSRQTAAVAAAAASITAVAAAATPSAVADNGQPS